MTALIAFTAFTLTATLALAAYVYVVLASRNRQLARENRQLRAQLTNTPMHRVRR